MTLRDEMAALYDELQGIPAELGFRERVVALRNWSVTGENKARQIPGTRTPVDTALSPAPKVREGGFKLIQYAEAHGGRLEEGDLLVEGISRSYTETSLRGAAEWVVDGIGYKLIRLVRKDTNWEAFLRRSKS